MNVRGSLKALLYVRMPPPVLGREPDPCLDFLQEHTAALVSFNNRNVADPSCNGQKWKPVKTTTLAPARCPLLVSLDTHMHTKIYIYT